ncbi:MAG: YqgE/AlgH family protein [Congregibacter sp.]
MKAASSDGLKHHFLLAMPRVDSGLFRGSITYICEHGEAGAMGLVINQPMDLQLCEIFDHLDIDIGSMLKSDFASSPVLAGGPVQIDHGFVLHPDEGDRWDSSLRINKDVRLTTSQDILKAIATGSGPTDYVITLGYAGWSAGQLEAEIADNSWLTLPADAQILFNTPVAQRLEAAAATLGVDMNLLTAQAGHA